MVRWVVGSILHGGPIELFLIPVSGPRLMYVLSCLLDDAYKITLAAKRKEYPVFPLLLSEWSFTICPTPCNRVPASAPRLV